MTRAGALLAITGRAAPEGDMRAQTRAVLADIDEQLAAAGSDKSKVLTARVRLADMDLRDEHDAAWREWIDPARKPVRALGLAPLQRPALVEITVTATR